MDRAVGLASYGSLLRRWRRQRGLSQLALSLQAEVSARHLSWLESGKAMPSRAMVLRLAERLELPLRERDLMLQAAGFAPLFGRRTAADPQREQALASLRQLLAAHEPWPALAVDGHWNLVAHNRMLGPLLASVDPALLQPPINVLRLTLHPQGLASRIGNLPAWRVHVLHRLQRQALASGDPALLALHAELAALGPADAHAAEPGVGDEIAATLCFDSAHGPLQFITTVTVFGAPRDVLLAELAVETLLPADAQTAAVLRGIHAELAPAA